MRIGWGGCFLVERFLLHFVCFGWFLLGGVSSSAFMKLWAVTFERYDLGCVGWPRRLGLRAALRGGRRGTE